MTNTGKIPNSPSKGISDTSSSMKKRKLEDFFNTAKKGAFELSPERAPSRSYSRMSTGGSARKSGGSFPKESPDLQAKPFREMCMGFNSSSQKALPAQESSSSGASSSSSFVPPKELLDAESQLEIKPTLGSDQRHPLDLPGDTESLEDTSQESITDSTLEQASDNKTSDTSRSGIDGSLEVNPNDSYERIERAGVYNAAKSCTEDEEGDNLEAVRKCFYKKKRKNKKVKVAVAEQELLSEEYEVKRIMKRTTDAKGHEAFVVLWKNYNYTFCTLQSLEDLEGSPDEVELLKQKEIGLDAVMVDLMHNRAKYDAPIETMFIRNEIPDELPPGQANIPDDLFNTYAQVSKHGYWKIKQLEIEWNDKISAYYERSRGRKVAPLYVEGWHPSAYKNMPKFDFIVGNSTWAQQALKIKNLSNFESCECCPCRKLCKICLTRHKDPMGIFTEIKNGLLEIKPKNTQDQYYWTYECNVYNKCKCYPKCEYRLLSRGRKVALVVFYEMNKGWTVRAIQNIPKGQFISEYLGEVITMKEANRRDTSYQFEIGKFWYVDALPIGNESRFFSHSCNPNAFVVRVYGLNQVIHKVGVFALKDISAGEEITFDYHPDYVDGDVPRSPGRCFCKEPNCRGWL